MQIRRTARSVIHDTEINIGNAEQTTDIGSNMLLNFSV